MSRARHPPNQLTKWWTKLRDFVTGGQKGLATVAAILVALVAIVTNWQKLEEILFPPAPPPVPPAATIVAEVDPFITLREFDAQAQLMGQGSGATAAVAPRGSSALGSKYRFATYSASTSEPSRTSELVVGVSEEQTDGAGQSTTTSAEQKIRVEGAQVREEAKHAEEVVHQEASVAAAEKESAEARVREEQKKEREAQKRAEETKTHGTTKALLEEATARKAVEKAKATVRAKRQEAARPLTQRRLEAGTPASRVEEVLHDAQLPERCRPTCGLKPLVEKVLKDSANNTAAAVQKVQTVNRSAGARVHYEVTLKALAGKVVVVTYSLVQTNEPPPPEWYLGTVVIRRVKPKHDPEVLRGTCWVPLPSSSRRYYVVLTAYDATEEVGYKKTSPFS
ncbi:MAG TPA: hypothetical protein VK680_00280 [Solirubrobacteraceae bacterium]|jgi:hypothetical protein|nr:hypothetical protein [Solirubrobacteraceae bacterium]